MHQSAPPSSVQLPHASSDHPVTMCVSTLRASTICGGEGAQHKTLNMFQCEGRVGLWTQQHCETFPNRFKTFLGNPTNTCPKRFKTFLVQRTYRLFLPFRRRLVVSSIAQLPTENSDDVLNFLLGFLLTLDENDRNKAKKAIYD